MSLDPDIKKAWIAELRSGKHHQGTKALCIETADGFCYCALGVLAIVLEDEEWIEHPVRPGVWGMGNPSYPTTGGIPNNIQKRIGMSRYDESRIIRMNDEQLLSFEQIADYIEEHL